MNANDLTFGIEMETIAPDSAVQNDGLRIGPYRRGIQVPYLPAGWKAEANGIIPWFAHEERFVVSTEDIMKKRYLVTLTLEERGELQAMVSKGTAAARKLVRARIPLLADEAEGGPGKSDPEIAAALGCGRATVERVRKRFVEEGLEAALVPKPTTRTYKKRLDGKAEAHLVAMVCGTPPEGRDCWTLRLLADSMVALGYVEAVSHETIRRTLKKPNLSPG